MPNPTPNPEAALRGLEKGRATIRRRKLRTFAAELRKDGWTCTPPEAPSTASPITLTADDFASPEQFELLQRSHRKKSVAADPTLSLQAKGVYLIYAAGIDIVVRSELAGEMSAAWQELLEAGYL